MYPECEKTCAWCLSDSNWVLVASWVNHDENSTTYKFICKGQLPSWTDDSTELCSNDTEITVSNEQEYDHEAYLEKEGKL